ncbi:PREDICTED: uncharacterized protein LOC108663025 [Theobroma cacao]|uniref:Uncharacterized protein LOC108663025 n=1 Tax=Theobroma cacao TaxID=3641 RepID=A0AB32WU01_THECC|nr:PREDICTED: uncharacterized protein LOC108663025 [Theobroma cacao]
MEEQFWKQKAGIKWLVEGERNTKFFHMRVKKKRIKSHIFRIQNPYGSWIEDPDLVKSSAVDFFSSLMKKESCAMTRFNDSLIPSILSKNDNVWLCAAPTMEELKVVVFNIDKDSVAGPDGFLSYFYQHCWEIVASDLLDAVVDFFHGAALPRGITSTTVVLLPKNEKASKWSDYRPIKRGLRQGDPISPLLFILAAKYLSRGLNALFAKYPSLHYYSNCSMSERISGWDNKILSPGGRITLLRNVLSSMPIYLLQTCNNIWSQYMRAKYCASQIPRYVQSKLHDSQTWKRMLASCPVCYFYDNGAWNVDKLNNVLPEEVVMEIIKISIDTSSTDLAYWVPTSDGQFTIKSSWETVRQRQADWIPVDLRLKSKGFHLASKCQHCNSEESLLHVMWECLIATQV